MVDGIVNNIYLINAPAGAGKTTKIRHMVGEHLRKHIDDNIVCITYTNRAADELKKDLKSKNIFVGTIHAFLNHFLTPFYKTQEVKDLYWELYKEEIENRVNNIEQIQLIEQSNQKYEERYGEVSLENIYHNLSEISYGETPYTALYYGRLSHDDLIKFAAHLFERYPILQYKLRSKYQLAFIDEYQDTAADVLKIFFNAYKSAENSNLYLLGDRMQRIYDTYDGSFEKEFSQLNCSIKLQKNYRSAKQIIDILNKIYDVPELKQDSGNPDKYIPQYNPNVIFTSDIDNVLKEKRKEYPDALILRVLNRERFEGAHALELYNSVSSMKQYQFGNKYSAVDVLTTEYSMNPDRLFSLLFLLYDLNTFYLQSEIGRIVTTVHRNKQFLETKWCTLRQHQDKNKVKEALEIIKEQFNKDQSIQEMLECLNEKEILNTDYVELILNDPEYIEVLDVSVKEVAALAKYLSDPHVSTQHGVKGESHDTVIFVAEDSSQTPCVKMTDMFKIWCEDGINVQELETFYYSYKNMVDIITKRCGVTVSKIDKPIYENNEEFIKSSLNDFNRDYKENKYFKKFFAKQFAKYLSNPKVTQAKSCLKINAVKGVLMAFKLFYVGCSRARKNLTIVVDDTKVKVFKNQLQRKFEECGFTISN